MLGRPLSDPLPCMIGSGEHPRLLLCLCPRVYYVADDDRRRDFFSIARSIHSTHHPLIQPTTKVERRAISYPMARGEGSDGGGELRKKGNEAFKRGDWKASRGL